MCVAENVEAADKNYAVDVHADTLKPWKIKKPRIELCHLWYVSCELTYFLRPTRCGGHRLASHVTQKRTTS